MGAAHRADLDRLSGRAWNPAERDVLDQVAALARRCKEGRGQWYLWFMGD